jgi:hypothetical protein
MMKNKVQILGAGLLALILAFTGCSNPLNERPEVSSPEAVSGGKIVIQLAGLDARTLGPAEEDIAGLKYRLILQSSKNIEEDIEDFSQPIERSIEEGSWTVGVLAYVDDDKSVAWGSENNVYVKDGETKRLSITLLPVTGVDAAGTFDYDIVFPAPGSAENFGYTSTILKLTPNWPNSSSPSLVEINLQDNNKAAAKLELPVGKYNLEITLESTRQVMDKALKAIVKETVYIYPSLTTKAHYTFTEDHFGADVYLKGTAFVNNNTIRDQSDENFVHNYIPTEVQIKLWDHGPYDDANIQSAPVTGDNQSGYTWDLPVSSEKIGGGNVSSVQLRLVVTSDDKNPQTLTGAWTPAELDTRQGNTNIPLTASVYSISRENNPYFSRIEGVSGIAHNSDAIGGTEIGLKIIPLVNYAVIASEVSSDPALENAIVEGDTFKATMPFSSITLDAQFFHLKGTAIIQSEHENASQYSPKKIEAYAEKWDGQEYIREQIGVTTAITDGAWEINPSGYVYTGDGTLYFKVFSEAVRQPNQASIVQSSVSDLTGTNTVLLPVPLFKVSGVQTETNVRSVTIHWDKADWATAGYYIYRRDNEEDWERITDTKLSKEATSYDDNDLPNGIYRYAVVGIYGTSTEGEKSEAAHSVEIGLRPPSNVWANPLNSEDAPLGIYVFWNEVSGADSYTVYRNGSPLTSVVEPWYEDSSNTRLDSVYRVVADSSAIGPSNQSDSTTQVFWQIYQISLEGFTDEYVNAYSFKYYRFTANDTGYYSFQFTNESSDVYGYLYKNGSYYGEFDSVWRNGWLSANDEVILAVRSYSFYTDNSYDVIIGYSQ